MKTIKQLAPNQFYFINDNKIVFQSYNTIVCEITNFENSNEPIIKITENQPQSKTTAKFLNMFLSLHTSINNYKNI
jgi:predicted ABC-type transport system involved in lysophospholipase L1 biosynthesis ATPase subunit